MIEHTMQEWADFTGCYVAKQECDTLLELFDIKPSIKCHAGYHDDYWTCEDNSEVCHTRNSGLYKVLQAREVADFAEHDWRVLVEPSTEAGE